MTYGIYTIWEFCKLSCIFVLLFFSIGVGFYCYLTQFYSLFLMLFCLMIDIIFHHFSYNINTIIMSFLFLLRLHLCIVTKYFVLGYFVVICKYVSAKELLIFKQNYYIISDKIKKKLYNSNSILELLTLNI